jgi:mRNA-degrading endonuclease RelE of RelBE toxin-antitoxin system
MKILWTPPFERDFRALPRPLQKRVEKTLRLLALNPRHPSLQAKKMEGTQKVWEARVSLSYRITYQLAEDALLLRRVGTHDILRKEGSQE